MAAGAVTDKTRVRKMKHAFEWAFGLGFVAIFAAKLGVLGQPPIVEGIVASAVGIVIMMLYVAHQKRDRPESEQPRLGDEVYYLGLLYTLTSLCAALVSLYLLDGGEQQTLVDRTDEMIGSFGIALLTTMAGVVMRMPLQRRGTDAQATIIRIPHTGARIEREPGGGRTGPAGGSVEIEGVTVDLERYAHELRRQLQTSTNAFASHANQAILQARTVHAHMDEMMQAFHDGLEKKAKAELESLEALYKAIAARAEEVMKRTETQQAAVQSALEKLEAQVKGMDESIERIRTGSGEVAENLRSVGAQAKASTRAFAEGEKAVTEGLSVLAEATGAEKTYQAARAQFAKEIGETFKRQAEEWTGVQRRAGEALKEMGQINQALAGLGQGARRTSEELTSLPGGIHTASEAIERFNMGLKGLQSAMQEDGLINQALAGLGQEARRTNEELTSLPEGVHKASEAIERFNTGLKGLQSAMQDNGLKLIEVLKQAIIAFEEAKRAKSRSLLGRIFRRG